MAGGGEARGRSLRLYIALIATSHLTPPSVKNDISNGLWILGLFDYGPSAFQRVIQLFDIDTFNVKHLIEGAEILNRIFHAPRLALWGIRQHRVIAGSGLIGRWSLLGHQSDIISCPLWK